MPRLPGPENLGGVASGRSGRAIATVDTTAVGEGIARMGRGIESAGANFYALEQQQKQKEDQTRRYDLAAKMSDFQAAQRDAYDEALKNMPPGAEGFPEAFQGRYREQAERFYKEQVPEDLRPTARASLHEYEGKLMGAALDAATKEKSRFHNARTDEMVDRSIKLAANNPADDQTTRTELLQQQALIKHNPHLTPVEREEKLAKLEDQFAIGVGSSLVSDKDAVKTVFQKSEGARVQAAMSFFRSQGWTPAQAAGIVGNLLHESGGLKTSARNPGDGADGSDSIGLAQWNGKRAQELQSFAAARGKPVSDFATQLAFVQHELSTSESGAAARLRQAGDVNSAAAAFLAYERPAGFNKGPEGTHGWSNRLAQSQKALGASGDGEAPKDFQVPENLGDVGENDHARARRYFQERFPNASSDVVEKSADAMVRAKQNFDVAENQALLRDVAARTNSLQNALQDGDAGFADIEAARKEGWLSDADSVSKMRGILESRNKQSEIVQTGMRNLADPNYKWDPYSDDARSQIDAVLSNRPKNGSSVLDGLATGDEQAQAFVQNVVERTGILPKAVISSLRGRIAGRDQTQALSALQAAQSFYATNPNAFANVEGGDDLRNSAVAFTHMVEDLGLSAEDAAKRTIEMGTPEYQRKAKLADVEVDKAVKGLRAYDFQVQIANGWGTSTAEIDPATERGLFGDYAENFRHHLTTTGDVELAKKLATADLKKVWGVTHIGDTNRFSNGRFMKYPPEVVFGAVGGSTEYIGEQLVADVKQKIGKDIALRDIRLDPAPRFSALLADKTKKPYYIVSVNTEDANGIKYFQPILGAGFAADPELARSTLAPKAAAAQEENRAMVEKAIIKRKERSGVATSVEERRARGLPTYVGEPSAGGDN